MTKQMSRLESAARLAMGECDEPTRPVRRGSYWWTAERAVFVIAVAAIAGFASFGLI